MPTLRERFLAKTERGEGCWMWTGYRTPEGYGYIKTGKYSAAGHPSPEPAHRVGYELFVGPIPEGLQLDHLCRNTSCVNPAHLEPVTNQENSMRVFALECRNGHRRTPDNTYICPSGTRRCRECRRLNDAAA